MNLLIKIRNKIAADNITVISVMYLAAVIILMLSRNISLTPDRLFLILALLAVIVGRAKSFLKDWTPFLALFLAYEILRGFADSFGSPNYTFLINSDLALFGFNPTIALQKMLYDGNEFQWYDHLGVLVYFLHFANPLIAAFILWWKDRLMYWKYIFGLLLLSYTAFIFFIFFPSAPPWMASQKGYLPKVNKIINEVLDSNKGNYSISYLYQKLNPNPVAAFPSLHAAFPWYTALALIQFNPVISFVFLIISFAIFFSIVYLGEHYAIDAIAGMILATIAYLIVYQRKSVFNRATIKKIIYFTFVGTVFITNIIMLIRGRENIGFGSYTLAIIGLIIGFAGLILWLLGFYFLRHTFSLLPKAGKLVRNGPYKYFKHPIYLGISMSLMGLALAKGSANALLFAALITTPMNIIRAIKEERLLKEKYKEEYR